MLHPLPRRDDRDVDGLVEAFLRPSRPIAAVTGYSQDLQALYIPRSRRRCRSLTPRRRRRGTCPSRPRAGCSPAAATAPRTGPARRPTVLAGAVVDLGDVGGDLRRAGRRLLDVAGDLLGGAACSSTAAAMAAAISAMRPMVPPISLIAATDSCVAVCMPAICVPISSVALAVCAASALTSWATTAKPLPASPARAASIVALSASRLVCSAIAVMSLTTSPMRPAACDSSAMRPSVFSACLTASLAIRVEFLHLPADLADRGGHFLGRGAKRNLHSRRPWSKRTALCRTNRRVAPAMAPSAPRRLRAGRGGRYRAHHARHSRLEGAGDLVHVGAALLGHAARGFLLGDFELLDADEAFP